MKDHNLDVRTKEVVVRTKESRFICSCGYETKVASEMDSHLHWEIAERYQAVVEAAEAVSDANFRRLEHELRKHGWGEQADKVQAFRKVLEDYVGTKPCESVESPDRSNSDG